MLSQCPPLGSHQEQAPGMMPAFQMSRGVPGCKGRPGGMVGREAWYEKAVAKWAESWPHVLHPSPQGLTRRMLIEEQLFSRAWERCQEQDMEEGGPDACVHGVKGTDPLLAQSC